MEYKFTQDKAGCPNGRTLVEFKEGDIVEGGKLGEYLFAKWLEKGIIVKIGKDAGKKAEEGNETKELTEEEIGELVYQAKELLDTEDVETINFDKLKEIGVALKINGMIAARKPQTILDKINEYIDEYEGEDEEETEEDAGKKAEEGNETKDEEKGEE